MNTKLKVSFVLILLNTTNSFSFEVNTHQAITRCATTTACNQNGAVNLHKFAENALLNKESYKEETFDKYGETYFEYANDGKGFTAWGIGFQNTNYQALIEAGVILEDSVYHNEDTTPLYLSALDGADGRFNNHFYSAQTPTTKGPLMLTI